MSIYIKNNSGGNKTYVGQLIADQAYHLIDPSEEIAWANDSSLLSDIGSGDAIVAKDDSGSNDLADVAAGIAYLRGEIQEVLFAHNDASGRPEIANVKSRGNFSTKITHNLCDKTSWVVSETDSTWELKPAAGELLVVWWAEADFVRDIDLTNHTLYFDYYAWVGGGSEAVVETTTINSINELFKMGNRHYSCPALPEAPGGITTLEFRYKDALELYGDDTPGKLSKVILRHANHDEITGSDATVAFTTTTEAL